ncbi:hypothetical protein PRIC2_006718 [Phytophthora ramorum]
MEDLLALLQQMAGRENQQQVRQFYSGRDSGGSASYSWNQRRKLFRQCRRGLLLCWKFLVAQLNDEKAMLSTGTRNLYFQLVGIIMERVEFHLPTNASDTEDAVPTRAKTPKAPGHTANNAGMGWLANSPTASMNGMDFGDDERDNSGSSATANSENVNAYANQNLGNDAIPAWALRWQEQYLELDVLLHARAGRRRPHEHSGSENVLRVEESESIGRGLDHLLLDLCEAAAVGHLDVPYDAQRVVVVLNDAA